VLGPIDGAGPPTEPTGASQTVALVVSTRNEALHVGAFVERVEAALAPFPVDWHAEVIDAGAVRSGLARADGTVLCVIDADLQHPPEILPELLAPVLLGRADICIGSRYRRGEWAAGLDSRWRRLAARASGALLRWLFPATRLTSDPGSGLFAVRRDVLEPVALRPRGSWVLAEILVRGAWHTACDVPYQFALVEDGGVHLGAGAPFRLTRELISLLLGSGLASPTKLRSAHRGAGRSPRRRRVARVHVELLRGTSERDSEPAKSVRSGEVV
jgi:Glycosyl transferase family 2